MGILVIDLYNLAGMPVKGGNSVSGLQMTKVLTNASFKTQNFYSIPMKDAENIKSWVSLLTNLFLSRHLIEIAKKVYFIFYICLAHMPGTLEGNLPKIDAKIIVNL